jgi:hypothetical protein
MIRRKQWVLLPARLILGERNLKLIPLGVFPPEGSEASYHQ